MNLNESLNITDIDFSKVKYFKKVDHNGNTIQYSKNEIVTITIDYITHQKTFLVHMNHLKSLLFGTNYEIYPTEEFSR